jgi:hypothetical protein
MNGKKKILLASMAVLLTLTVQGQVLPYNVSLLNDLKTAYHHGDQAASEAVGKLEVQNILYYQLIKK